MMTQLQQKRTWKEICAIEPRLAGLYGRLLQVRDDFSLPMFCANQVWYGTFKNQMLYLVGWQAWDERLRTTDDYDTAYRVLYSLLPPCRNCYCF